MKGFRRESSGDRRARRGAGRSQPRTGLAGIEGNRLFQYQQGADVELRGGRGRPAHQDFAGPERQARRGHSRRDLAMSQSSAGALRIKMHNKLAALVVLGKYLGMFDERPQNSTSFMPSLTSP